MSGCSSSSSPSSWCRTTAAADPTEAAVLSTLDAPRRHLFPVEGRDVGPDPSVTDLVVPATPDHPLSQRPTRVGDPGREKPVEVLGRSEDVLLSYDAHHPWRVLLDPGPPVLV